ncbi:hypothetical protein AB6Q56_05545 [Dechloromonas sp. ARDL1]|uniref:hypothetical protein n=1 Tax=Dechloromonas sp. ARDL1 TaxID=3322121 RepID=UPI003DA71663
MIRFVLSVISVNLYNDQTRCFVDRMGKYFSSLLGDPIARHQTIRFRTYVIFVGFFYTKHQFEKNEFHFLFKFNALQKWSSICIEQVICNQKSLER